MKERKAWIDGLRGLAMLFVVYGHICNVVRPYSVFASPIKLPLFFAVTGFVFSFRSGNTKAFFKGLFQQLILPWLIFSVLYTIVKIAGGVAVSEAVYEFVSGRIAWYIPCLIVSEIMLFFIGKWIRDVRMQFAVMFAVAAAGYFISRMPGELCSFIGRSMIAQFYILIGYVFRNLDQKIGKKRLFPALFGMLYAALGAYVLFGMEASIVDVRSNSYYDPLMFAVMVVCGCSFLFYYARFVKTPGWLAFIGRHTLIIYLFHARILEILSPLVKMIPHSLRSNVLTGLPISLAICAALCAVCGLCSVLIGKYIPVLAGKGFKKSA